MPLLKPFRGIQINRAHPLSRGLVACWLMNEAGGNKIFDSCRFPYSQTWYNQAKFSPAKFGYGLEFDGVDDYIVITKANTPINITGNQVTISVWVKLDALGSASRHFAGMQADAASPYNEQYYIRYQGTTTKTRFVVGTSTSPSNIINANTAYAVGAWYHVVGVYDGSFLYIYLNGKSDATPVACTGTILSNTHNFSIGATDTATLDFDGIVDNVMVWKRALSATEIAHLYREPFCIFERKVSPGLLLAPAGQIVSLAGTCAAGTNVTASLKVTYRCAGALAAQAQMYGCLTVVGQVPPGEQWFTASLNIEQDWLLAALFGGMTANAFKLGMTLTLGWFWMRRSGCSVLYRGPTIDQIDFTNALTVAEQDAGQISPPFYVAHASNSTYFYAVGRFNTCGYRERTLAAVAKVTIDAQGNLMPPQPNNVFAAAAEQVDGNMIQLTWFYCPLRQESEPVCFRIYHDAATGQIDYQNPIGTISYHGQRFYSYLTEPLAGGRYLFAVRAEDADGVQNGSLARSIIQLVTEIPEAIDILSAESV